MDASVDERLPPLAASRERPSLARGAGRSPVIHFTPQELGGSGSLALAATGHEIAGRLQPSASERHLTSCFSGSLEGDSTDSGRRWLWPMAGGLLSKKLARQDCIEEPLKSCDVEIRLKPTRGPNSNAFF